MSRKPSLLGPLDAGFLLGDTREAPMQIGALMPFTPPADAPADWLRNIVEDSKQRAIGSPWNLKLETPWLKHNPMPRWIEDQDFDIDYHVRRTAVASPGDERELGILLARLHSNDLDLRKPLWECHIIEGLEGGRFAMYMKLHHALIDGFTGMKLLARALSTDPEQRNMPLIFAVPPRQPRPRQQKADAAAPTTLNGTIAGAASKISDSIEGALAVTRALGRTVLRRGEDANLVHSLSAPDCLLNRRISRNRRFATQQYPTSRLKHIADTAGVTLNDVLLSICGGGLRTYLQELDELPSKPLIAFVPVNIRPKDDEGGGNAVGAILASLGTHIANPVDRLRAVSTSTTHGKRNLSGMTQSAMMAYSAALLAPAAVQIGAAMSPLSNPLPNTFNVIISNVPGPQEPLYLNGARLEASYPLSIPGHGMALNITIHSYADTMNFGFIGCRDTVPHLQRLAVHTGSALDELESALVPAPARAALTPAQRRPAAKRKTEAGKR